MSRAAAWLVLMLACVVFAGWAFDLTAFTSIVPGYSSMKFNTALCLAALAGALLVRPPGASVILLGIVLLVAGLSLIEIVTAQGLGIDELVVADPATAESAAPGRMAPATAVALLALAVAGLTGRAGLLRTTQCLLVVPLVVAVTALLGYLYDVEQLYRVASLSSVALHTAGALLVLTFATGARIDQGVVPWLIAGRGPGAVLVRLTAPVIVVGLVALGWIRMRLGDAGAFGEHFGIALMVMLGIAIAVGATTFAAARLDVTDGRRTEAEASLRQLNLSLEEGRDEAWNRAEALAEELSAERRRFDQAISSTESVVWTLELMDESCVPVYASPNLERILGDQVDRGETALAALARLADPDQREVVLAFRDAVRRGAAEAEVRLSVDGRAKWMRVQGNPRAEGDRLYVDGIMADVTDLHEMGVQREALLAQEQVQVQRLFELNRARDEFIAVAGHELRTPVAVILGFVEMLADPAADEAVRAEALAVIERRAWHLSELVERVFDLAKVESAELDLALSPVSVRDLVDEVTAAHRPAAEAAGIRLEGEVAPLHVLADGARLQQVFDNLVSNAVKYTPAGGRIVVSSAARGDTVVIEVADDGIGVEAEELPRLFDRMFRSAGAREAGIPGTGLGLAVTKALVEAQHGTLTVRPQASRGLVFTVTLPHVSGAVHAPTAS